MADGVSRPDGLYLSSVSLPATPLTLCGGLLKIRPEGL